jgi:hypothetical protein
MKTLRNEQHSLIGELDNSPTVVHRVAPPMAQLLAFGKPTQGAGASGEF